MRTCPSCGRFITDASTPTCPHCGASLEPGPATSAPPEPAAPGYGQPTGAPPYVPNAAPPPPAYQPPYGQPPYGQPTYGSGYGAPGGYPGAYRPGMDWKPNAGPSPRPWGRIIGGVVAALVLIALVMGVIYNQAHPSAHGNDTSASAAATALSSGTLLSDSMLTVDSGWSNDSHCYFDTDGYHIRDGYICFAPIGNQVDGTESVTVKQLTGPTTYSYGLVFRLVDTHNYYFYGIDSNGKWVMDKVVNDKVTHLQDFTVNIAIKGGLNTANSLSVTMKGTTFDFSVNGQKVGAIHDSTFPEGKWGLAGDSGLNVVFTDYLAHQ